MIGAGMAFPISPRRLLLWLAVAARLTLAAAVAAAADELPLGEPLDERQLGDTAVNRDNMQDVVKTETPRIESGTLSGDDLRAALTRRCAAYSLLRQLDRASADCDRALSIAPGDGRALALRSHIALQRAAFAPALADLDKAIGGGLPAEDLGYAYLLRAIAHQALGDEAPAIADLRQATAIEPTLQKLYQDIGRELLHGRPSDALDEALAADPVTAYGYLDRGTRRLGRGQFDLAIGDFDAALAREPRLAEAFAARGEARYYKGDNDGALADLRQALDFNAKLSDAAVALAYAQYNAGDYAAAGAAFARQSKAVLSDLYAPLWADLAYRRAPAGNAAGVDPAHEIDRRLARLDGKSWPRPLLLSFVGRLGPAAVLKAAAAGDPSRQARQRCEADFFLGTRALIDGKLDDARRLLQEAAESCPPVTREGITARTELARLAK
jgi:tetratricopeptide (TPR) repeat protein